MPFPLVRKLSKFLNQEFTLVNDFKKREKRRIYFFTAKILRLS